MLILERGARVLFLSLGLFGNRLIINLAAPISVIYILFSPNVVLLAYYLGTSNWNKKFRSLVC